MTPLSSDLDPRLRDYFASRAHARGLPAQCLSLSGDASTRRYFRIAWPKAPSTIVALYPESFDAPSTTFFTVGDVLLRLGMPLPKIIDHDGGLGIFEQEDLGDLTLYEALSTASMETKKDWYRDAIEELVVVQREAARVPHRAPCFHTAFDIEKLSW